MKVFITGGAGFIGKWLVRKLPGTIDIVLVDSLEKQVHAVVQDFSTFLKNRATCIKADIRNPEAYKSALKGSDIVVHLASLTGTGQSMYEISRYVQYNIDGTAKLLDAIKELKCKPRRIILASSRAVYGEGAYRNKRGIYYPLNRKFQDLKNGKWEIYKGKQKLQPEQMQEDHLSNPVSFYGLTKFCQEQLLQYYAKLDKIDYVILRLQNVYGPEQDLQNPYTGILGIFTNSIFNQQEVELFEDGNMTRDFVYIEDVVEVIIKSIHYQNTLQSIINVGSGNAIKLKELVFCIAQLAEKNPMIKLAGRFRTGDIRNAVANMKGYEKIFGKWQPQSLVEGLKKYLEWYLLQDPPSPEKLKSSLKEMEQKGLLSFSK